MRDQKGIRLADLGPGSRALRVAGLMSGTSADGVDVAVVDIWRRRIEVLAFETIPYKAPLRAAVLEACNAATSRVDAICHLNFVLGDVFSDAVAQVCARNGITLDSLDLIGSHGQTIHHLPAGPPAGTPRRAIGAGLRGGRRLIGSTLQIAEPSIIAQRTGVTTIADFRPRDMAAGGQGAPLVPYADIMLFSHARKNRALQNIGGIANVTYLPASDGVGQPDTQARLPRSVRAGSPPGAGLLAFDTGPGNMIMDRLAAIISGGRLKFDRGGRLAHRGRVNQRLLAELMRHPYLKRRPPKTTGREEFGVAFADDLLDRAKGLSLSPNDAIATATAFTARSIADAYAQFVGPVDEVILCGGGARNPVLVEMLRRELPEAGVMPMDELGISADAKEAISFAILAYQTFHNRPSNVPAATGASEPVVLGKIVPGRNWSRIGKRTASRQKPEVRSKK